MIAPVALALVALSTTWTLLGTASVWQATRRRPAQGGALAPVTVLKPLAGADPGLRASLETFFEQDHPAYELVFGVDRPDDPAVPVVRALMARHPHVPARLVIHAPSRGTNPKVRNLLGMIEHATHDLVLVSDSNVRAPAHYLSEAVATWLSDPSVGLVTNLFAGEGRGSLGAYVESVQLTGFVAAGAALPTALGDAAVVGKSMLFSRRELGSLGGLDRVADVLAEDYVIGKMFQHAGRRVAVARTVLVNALGSPTLRAVFERHVRWSMLRVRLRPIAHALEPLTCPLFVLPLAWFALGPAALCWWAAMVATRDVLGWWLLFGARRLHVPVLFGLARDVFALAVWVVAPWRRHVTWRGHRVRVGAGTVLYARS